MSVSWYVDKEGGQIGPLTGTQLKELARSGQLGPADRVRRSDHPNVVAAGKIKGLFASQGGGESLDTPASCSAEERHEPSSQAEEPTGSPPFQGAIGDDPSEAHKFVVQMLAICGGFTVLGIWLMAAGGHTIVGFFSVLFFGGGGVYGLLTCLAEDRKARAAGAGTPGKVSAEELAAPGVPSPAAVPAWLGGIDKPGLGLTVVVLLLVGLFLRFCTIDDARPFSSPLFWYCGACCLVLPGLVHRRPAANPGVLLLAYLLRSVVFFVAGFFGGVVLGFFLSVLGRTPFEDCLPVTFVLASLPTLLIPDRLDVLLAAANARSSPPTA